MDEIIWSSESLQSIVSALRETSDGLETELSILRHSRDEAPLALRDENGTFLDELLEQLSHAIRKLSDAAERASDLARAVQRTDTLFEETERAVRLLYESIALPAAGGEQAARPVSWTATAQVTAVPGLAEHTLTVPEWLSSLANQYFRDYSGDLQLPL